MLLHIAQRDEAVEPCVGHLFQYVFVGRRVIAVLFLLAEDFYQLLTLPDGLAGDGVRFRSADVVELHIGGRLRQGILNALRRNAHQSGAVLDVRNKLVPRPDCKVFDCSLIHWPLPPQEEQGLVFLNSPQFRHTLLYLLP